MGKPNDRLVGNLTTGHYVMVANPTDPNGPSWGYAAIGSLAGIVGGAPVDTKAPTILTSASHVCPEDSLFSVALQADEAVRWELVSGSKSPDFACYTLSGNTLAFREDLVTDFERPSDADGNNSYIVTVAAIDPAGNRTEKQITVIILDVVEIFPPRNLSPPSLSGNPQQGQTLTAFSGVWSDSPSSYIIQYLRDGVPIPNATGSSYALTADDVGHIISIAVTAINNAGTGTEGSGEVGPVIPSAPVNTAVPLITGTVQVGKTLTVTNGEWSNNPKSYARAWKSNGTPNGGTGATYVPVAADEGKNITCTVTATNDGGSTSRTSALTAPVLPAGSALAISGTPVLNAVAGSNYNGFSVAGAGGTGPYTYGVSSTGGPLPAGITIDASKGTVSATPPTTAGTYENIILEVTDSTGAKARLAPFTITVAAAVQQLAITISPGQATVGAPYSAKPVVTGGSGTKGYRLTGSLPTGMSFSSTTGEISGPPTTVGTAADLVIAVTDLSGSAETQKFSISVQSAGGLLLDTLSVQPLVAFSLRKVRAAYNGPCVRVRRSVDSQELDIGFDGSGVIDVAALSAFVGTTTSSDGFVVAWYDQSVNQKHATQLTAANQPKIVGAGSVQVSNGRPKILFGTTGQALSYEVDAGREKRSTRIVAEHRIASVSNLLAASASGGLLIRFKGTSKNLEILKQGSGIIATSTAAVGASIPSTLAVDYDAASGVYALNIDGGTPTTGTNVQTLTTGLTSIIGSATVAMATMALMDFGGVIPQADSDKIQASQKAYYTTA